MNLKKVKNVEVTWWKKLPVVCLQHPLCLGRAKVNFCQLLNSGRVSDVRQAEMHTKKTVLWDIPQRSLVEIDWRFRGAYCFHHQGDENLSLIALMMEAAGT
jgi:hypothetical protein